MAGRKAGARTAAWGVRVDSGVAKGAFHLRRRQLGDRSTIRPTLDHPSFIESDLMARPTPRVSRHHRGLATFASLKTPTQHLSARVHM